VFEDIIEKLSGIEGVNQKILEEEVNVQLVAIYLEWNQEQEQKQAEKESKHREVKEGKAPAKRRIPAMKYSAIGQLRETINLAGTYCFLSLETDPVTGKKKVRAESEIEEADRIIIPDSSNGIDHFTFRSLEQVQRMLDEVVATETLDSLWQKVESTASAFIDTSERNRVLITADIIYTYFQDLVGMTHYLLLVGRPGSGKGVIQSTFGQLGYRVASISGPSIASIYSMLGSIEKGQVTISIDEANQLDQNLELLDVLKTGYKSTGKVPRVLDASSSNRVIAYFLTFGFKLIAAEHSPDSETAAGFLDRCFKIQCHKGKPKLKIDKILGSPNTRRHKPIVAQLNELRTRLFLFRMAHYDEPIDDVTLNIDGREDELCSPLIRLFRDANVLPRITTTLYSFIREKRENKSEEFGLYLAGIIRNIIAEKDKRPEGIVVTKGLEDQEIVKIEFHIIWDRVTAEPNGVVEKQTFVSPQYGEISMKKITQVSRDWLGAEAGDVNPKGSKRVITFDKSKLDKITLENSADIVIVEPDTSDTFDTLWQETDNMGEENDSQKSQNHENISQNIEKNNVNPSNSTVHFSSKKDDKVSEASKVSELRKAEFIQCPYPNCPLKLKTTGMLIDHGIKSHKGFPMTAELQARGHKVD
jgi:hypothetical protein